MSNAKEREAMQGEVPPTVPNGVGSNPAGAAQPNGQTVYGSSAQTQSAVPGPVANPVYGYGSYSVPVVPQVRIFREKKVVEAYLLWLILGPLGAHHFYLGRLGFGVLYFFTFGLCGCGYLIDLFRMPCLVKEANRKLREPTTKEDKSISDAYTLWFPFGLLGFHHFYLNKPGWGVAYFFTLGFCGIGWLVDLFRIPSLVKHANNGSPESKEKQVCTAYTFCVLPTGLLGGHHFYLNKHVYGLIYFFTMGNFGIGWIVDWFRIPVLVKRANKEIAFGDTGKVYLDDAYVMWFPLGLLGFHHFYMRRYVWGVLYFFTFGLMGVGWLVDACRMPCLVKEANKLNEERRRLHGGGYVISGPPVVVCNTNQAFYPHQQSPAGYGTHRPPPQQQSATGYPQQQQQQQHTGQQQQQQQTGQQQQQPGQPYLQQGVYPPQQGIYPPIPPSYQAQINQPYMEQPPPYSPNAVNPSVSGDAKQ